ncbi:HpcH/HpaI aldolase family protein [Aurantiacibacter rhizosphaerae]|uniref:2-dehydro-3-deoxyglucarate aldolase n=1 Tax=Aurantiacibacter rhizosphaerae TaxID=2691582 RepID=A0A844XC90_9SPHN|nr:aldolase/citrate lyase family protein [Aurantiacibacter rhizosphaerae]MWV27450.1 2-dehydro-3-deoxyglucarate aldolase [Aurantiacibacter rhizosphaerae]
MKNIIETIAKAERGLLGTWVKIPSLETVELLGHAGFDFVVIDMEHAPHTLETAYKLVFAAQAAGLAALVRLPDCSGSTIQPLLDGGADGLLVPRVTSLEDAESVTRKMVFSPAGERGLGTTSRAGRWGLGEMSDYLDRGDNQCLRMVQLEDWKNLEMAAEYAALENVNGIFIGHGDLMLSSGKPSADPEVRALTKQVLDVTRRAGIVSGAAAGTPEEAKLYLEMGFSLVMVSNDATIFGSAAREAVRRAAPPAIT